MTDDTYVMNEAWIRQEGRPDLIDEVADQFERPAPELDHPALERVGG